MSDQPFIIHSNSKISQYREFNLYYISWCFLLGFFFFLSCFIYLFKFFVATQLQCAVISLWLKSDLPQDLILDLGLDLVWLSKLCTIHHSFQWPNRSVQGVKSLLHILMFSSFFCCFIYLFKLGLVLEMWRQLSKLCTSTFAKIFRFNHNLGKCYSDISIS